MQTTDDSPALKWVEILLAGDHKVSWLYNIKYTLLIETCGCTGKIPLSM
jgi:hypothetical protein